MSTTARKVKAADALEAVLGFRPTAKQVHRWANRQDQPLVCWMIGSRLYTTDSEAMAFCRRYQRQQHSVDELEQELAKL